MIRKLLQTRVGIHPYGMRIGQRTYWYGVWILFWDKLWEFGKRSN